MREMITYKPDIVISRVHRSVRALIVAALFSFETSFSNLKP